MHIIELKHGALVCGESLEHYGMPRRSAEDGIKMSIKWNQEIYHSGFVTGAELYHYGVPKRSGRYKWGSGENPYHHAGKAGRLAKRQDKLRAKSEKMSTKISKQQQKMVRPLSARALKKEAKYGVKVAKREAKALKYQRRLDMGKSLSRRKSRKLAKYNALKYKQDKFAAKTAKRKAKIKQYQTKKFIYDQKIKKYDKKISKANKKQLAKGQAIYERKFA